MPITKHKHSTIGSILPLLAFPFALQAEPTATTPPAEPAPVAAPDKPTSLNPVVVTATRLPAPVSETPSIVENLDAKTLLERSPRSVPEALAEMPGVLVQRTGHGQGSPVIRGFTGYRTLALIEGVRLNNSAFRSGPNQYWNTIDTYSLSGMELLLGAGSVLYGSDAVGGTLNAFVRRPAYAESGSLWDGGITARYASGENSLIGRFDVGYSEAGRWGLTLGGTYKDFGNLEAAEIGTQSHTGYDEWDIDGTFEWLFDSGARLSIHHDQVHQNEAWRTHSTIYGKSWRGTTVGSDRKRALDQDRMLTFVQLDSHESDGTFKDWRISLSHQRQEESEDRIRSNREEQIKGLTVDTYGLWAQTSVDNPLGTLTWGADAWYDCVDSFRTDYNTDGSVKAHRIQGSVADDSNYLLSGLFAEQRFDIGERSRIWLGARGTYAALDAGRYEDQVTKKAASLSESWTDLSISARGTFELLPESGVVLFGGLSPAFRAPSLHDVTSLNNARSDEVETPSPGLDPENFLTAEIGIRAEGEKLSGSLTYYHTWIDDLMVARRTGQMIEDRWEVQNTNGGKGDLDGVEARLGWQISDHWSTHASFAWQEGHTESYISSNSPLVNEPISRLAPLTVQAGLRYEADEEKWWAEALVIHAERQDRLSTRDRNDTQRIPPGGTPGHTIATIRGGVRVLDALTLTAGVENFTDEAYRAHGSGVNESGLNVVLGAQWRF